jgi:hypothetical protein
MRAIWFLIALSVAGLATSHADSPASVRRDKALRGIEACLKRNWVPSRECKNLNEDVETLVAIYREGDKTVLPTLLRFTYLTGFYGEALTSDPDGFLTAVSHLSEKDQRAVVAGIAGQTFGLTRAQFDAVRATLMEVPDSSPNYQIARACLKTLEAENASFLINYFPPQTFSSRAGDFEVHWFAGELYALGEQPVWPPPSGGERTYRITVLPSFFPPESVTLTVTPDGTGQIDFRTLDPRSHGLVADGPHATSPQQFADFLTALNRIEFWQLPTELPPDPHHILVDGTYWILEGAQDGGYHIILRTCPGKTPFGEAAQKLFDLAGHKSKGGCRSSPVHSRARAEYREQRSSALRAQLGEVASRRTTDN